MKNTKLIIKDKNGKNVKKCNSKSRGAGRNSPLLGHCNVESFIKANVLIIVLKFAGSAPQSRSGSRVDVSILGVSGTYTAPSTPQTSPPVSPKRQESTSGRISVPLALKEDDFDELL